MNDIQKEIDILLTNALIATANKNNDIYTNGFIAIKDNKIIDIGHSSSSKTIFSAKKTINCEGKLITPGFINTHCHNPMSLYRGYANDKDLMDWLQNYIWPLEAKTVNQDMAKLGSELSLIELIRCGTTTFNDMYFFAQKCAEVTHEIGLRAFIGESVIDMPNPNCKTPDDTYDYIRSIYPNWKSHDLINITITPHAPYSVSKESFRKSKDLSEELNIRLHTHIAEAVGSEFPDSTNSSVQDLHDLKILDETVTAAHCIHLNQQDIEIFSQTGVKVSHNPESNMKLSSGTAPIMEFYNNNVDISIGTDGPASNNDLSLFNAMKTTALLQKLHLKDPKAADAQLVFNMATIGGAKCLGIEDITGSLEKGKVADLVIIDLNKPHLTPLYDIYAQIVYAMQASDVETVIVNGKILMENKIILTADEEKILQSANEFASKTGLNTINSQAA